MTQAQKLAKEKFKKAIEYRKKFGVSLKEAFAKVYNTKGVQKAVKKVKRKVKSVKKTAKKKIVSTAKKYLGSVKKKSSPKKKISEQSILNKIHVVKKGVDKLDEAQHKHMMSGVNIKRDLLSDYNKILIKQKELEYGIMVHQKYLKTPDRPKQLKANDRKLIKLYKLILNENKTHAKELKKFL